MSNSFESYYFKIKNKLIEEDGAVGVLLFALFSIGFILTCIVVTFNLVMQITVTNHTKVDLDVATKAAVMDIDIEEAMQGRLVWDSIKGQESFYNYLRLNMKLDSSNNPLPNSYLKRAPVIRMFEEVSADSYPYVVDRSITLYAGTKYEITRTIRVTIYGPSVVSIIEVTHPYIGLKRTEPVLVSSVASIRY